MLRLHLSAEQSFYRSVEEVSADCPPWQYIDFSHTFVPVYRSKKLARSKHNCVV